MCMKKRINITLDPAIHREGINLAKENGTGFSGWITQAIVAASKKKRPLVLRVRESPEPPDDLLILAPELIPAPE